MSKPRVLLALALALLAITSIALRVPRERSKTPAANAAPSASDELEHGAAPVEPPAHATAPQQKATEAPPSPGVAAALAELKRTPALRAAFQRESPDATAHQAEARLRAIYGAEPDADTILRDVRCTRSVCKLDLRWSPELNKPYNDALVHAIKAFSRDIDLTPDITLGGPEMPIPMTLFIARPGYSVESLVAEQAALLQQ